MATLLDRLSPRTLGRAVLNSGRGALRHVLPQAIHVRLRRRLGDVVLMYSIRALMRAPHRITEDIRLARLLYYGWSSGWCASPEYLQRACQLLEAEGGPVLECGCGLSTLVLGVVAQALNQIVVTLENSEPHAIRVRRHLSKYSISCVDLDVAPLRSYGNFDWYAPSSVGAIGRQFRLVICDGPVGTTRGGRIGFLPVMRSHLSQHCVILLDDVNRIGEQKVLAEWQRLVPMSVKVHSTDRPFAEIVLR